MIIKPSAALLGLWALGTLSTWAAPAPIPTVGADLDGKVILYWTTPVPAATAYEVRRFLVQTIAATATATLTPTGTETIVPAVTATPTTTSLPTVAAGATLEVRDYLVTNGRTYRYEICSVDSGGPGPSGVVTVVPYAVPKAAYPVTVRTDYSGAFNLSWGDCSTTYPVATYEIYRYAITGGTITAPPIPTVLASSPTPIVRVSSRSYVDVPPPATPAASAYYYVVRAVDDHQHQGLFPASTPSTPEPPASGGGLPQLRKPVAAVLSSLVQVTPSIGVTYAVRLVWNGPQPSENVEFFTVFRDSTPVATVTASPLATMVWDDTAVSPGEAASGSWVYMVGAQNPQWTQTPQGYTYSNPVAAVIARPASSGSLRVTPNATSTSVQLSWNQALEGSYGLKGYRVYSMRGLPTPGADTPTPIAVLEATPSATQTTVYVDAPVANAHDLSYWVEPFDMKDLSGPKITAMSFTLRLAPTPPPTVSASGAPGNHRVSLSWSPAGAGFYGPVQAYSVYRFGLGTETPTPQFVATVPSSVTSYQDVVDGLSVGSTVVYKVAASDALTNLSDLSNTSNQTVLIGSLAPLPASNVKVTSDGVSLLYSWDSNPASDAVTEYRLYGSDWPGAGDTPTPEAAFIPSPGVMSFAEDTTNSYEVRVHYLVAVNASGNGQPATLGGIRVPPYAVAAQTVSVPARAVSVSWNLDPTPATAAGADGFRVYRSLAPGAGFTPIAEKSLLMAGHLDSNAPAGVTCYYRMTLKSGNLAESPLYPTMAPTPEDSEFTWPKAPHTPTPQTSGSSVALLWAANDAVETVTSYRVYRNGNSTPVSVVSEPTFSCSETPGVKAFYNVSAVNASGESDHSSAVTVLPAPAMTPQIGLTPPAGVTTTTGLAWISGLEYSNDVTSYVIYRTTAPGNPPTWETFCKAVSAPATYLSDAGVLGYTNYYRVVARDASLLEADHAGSALLTQAMAPGAPVSLNPSPSDLVITLSWPTPEGDAAPTGYHVYRSTTANGAKTELLPPPAAPSYADSVVTPGWAYYYQVSAENASGEGPRSAEKGALAASGPSIAVTPLSSRNIITWPPVTPVSTHQISGYVVHRAQAPSTLFAQLGSMVSGAAASQVSDTTVSSGLTYVYKVAPSTSSGALGGFSVPVTQAVRPQPVQLSAVAGFTVVQLRWDYQGGGGTSYTVWRRLGTEDDSAFKVVASGLGGTDYIDTNVVNKTFYAYKVETIASSGLTAMSDVVFALPAKPPVVGADGTVKAVPQQGGVSLSWAPPANAGGFDPANQYPLAGYRIYRSVDGGGTYQFVGEVSAEMNGYFDTVDTLSGSAFTYLVRAYDVPPDAPDSAHETPYPIVTVASLSSGTALDRNALRPFGLPNEREVNVRYIVTKPGKVTIKIYSLSGTFVKTLVEGTYEAGVHWEKWDGKNKDGQLVASGVYLFLTQMPDRKEAAKIAVVK